MGSLAWWYVTGVEVEKQAGAGSQRAKLSMAQESGPYPEAVGRNHRITEELHAAQYGARPWLEDLSLSPHSSHSSPERLQAAERECEFKTQMFGPVKLPGFDKSNERN